MMISSTCGATLQCLSGDDRRSGAGYGPVVAPPKRYMKCACMVGQLCVVERNKSVCMRDVNLEKHCACVVRLVAETAWCTKLTTPRQSGQAFVKPRFSPSSSNRRWVYWPPSGPVCSAAMLIHLRPRMNHEQCPPGWLCRPHVIPQRAHLGRIRRKIAMAVLRKFMTLDYFKRSLHMS